MSWFDEQIKTRMHNDQDSFENAFVHLSSVVMGKGVLAAALKGERERAQNAIEEILRFYHVRKAELPASVTEVEDILEHLMRPSGIMRRSVALTGDWYRDGVGPLLASTTDGDVIALIPDPVSGYRFMDYETGKVVRVTAKNKDRIQTGLFPR